MKAVFGPQTRRVLEFLGNLRDLSPAEIDRVTDAWRQASDLDRAEAWAQVQRVTTEPERYPILAAASVARREAMDIARKLSRPDWAFWAAAWDAAAAIAGEDRIGASYEVLTAPLAAVMPPLRQGQAADQGVSHAIPAQRPSESTPRKAPRRRRAADERQGTGEHPAMPRSANVTEDAP